MSLFKDVLGGEESLFKNEVALSYDYIPKLIPYREMQQRQIAACIRPLFQDRNGKNILVYGQPGVGKTVACTHIIQDIEEETDEVLPIYINCWQKNTSFKIILEICGSLGYKFTQNKRTEELLKVIKQILTKKKAVFFFDEVDKVDDFDFLYYILEEVYRKSIVLITNYREWLIDLEDRIKSRLTPETLEFLPYNKNETCGILKQRVEYAFVPNIWEDGAFQIIAEKTYELQDIRQGLYLLKEAGDIAEGKSLRKINAECAKEAISKLDKFCIKDSEGLDSEAKFILKIVQDNKEKKIGDLFKIYQKEGGNLVYKSFQRKIKKLEENKFISVTKIDGGKEGKTSIIEPYNSTKKLSDF